AAVRSFPTRRSSDLGPCARGAAAEARVGRSAAGSLSRGGGSHGGVRQWNSIAAVPRSRLKPRLGPTAEAACARPFTGRAEPRVSLAGPQGATLSLTKGYVGTRRRWYGTSVR